MKYEAHGVKAFVMIIGILLAIGGTGALLALGVHHLFQLLAVPDVVQRAICILVMLAIAVSNYRRHGEHLWFWLAGFATFEWIVRAFAGMTAQAIFVVSVFGVLVGFYWRRPREPADHWDVDAAVLEVPRRATFEVRR